MAWLAVGLVVPALIMIALFSALRAPGEAADPQTVVAREAVPEFAAEPSPPESSLRAPRPSGRMCPQQAGEIPPLVEAAACGDSVRLAKSTATGASLAASDPRAAFAGRTALHHAAARGDLDSVRLLLDRGADPNAGDQQGETPLHLLTIGDKVVQDEAIARALLSSGANVTARNNSGRTAGEALLADERRARMSSGLSSILRDAAQQQEVIERASEFLERDAKPDQGMQALDVGASIAFTSNPKAPAVIPPSESMEAPAPPPEALPSPESRVRETIHQWARAWSSRDAEAYLSHYAPDFSGAGGASRAEWEALRRKRITEPTSIDVTIVDLIIEAGTERATAYFTQAYRSPGYADRGPKVLTLQRFGDRWKIVGEESPDRS